MADPHEDQRITRISPFDNTKRTWLQDVFAAVGPSVG